MTGRRTRSAEERFWSKIDKRGPDDCWLWQGSLQNYGYGQFFMARGVNISAHRMVWKLTHGQKLPTDVHLRHLCEERYSAGDRTSRRCCNPSHLIPGSLTENLGDCMIARRMPIRAQRYNYKYTDEQVLMCIVYRLAARSSTEIEQLFGISARMVRKYTAGKRAAANLHVSRNRQGV